MSKLRRMGGEGDGQESGGEDKERRTGEVREGQINVGVVARPENINYEGFPIPVCQREQCTEETIGSSKGQGKTDDRKHSFF